MYHSLYVKQIPFLFLPKRSICLLLLLQAKILSECSQPYQHCQVFYHECIPTQGFSYSWLSQFHQKLGLKQLLVSITPNFSPLCLQLLLFQHMPVLPFSSFASCKQTVYLSSLENHCCQSGPQFW